MMLGRGQKSQTVCDRVVKQDETKQNSIWISQASI